jgi:hypothetical protein
MDLRGEGGGFWKNKSQCIVRRANVAGNVWACGVYLSLMPRKWEISSCSVIKRVEFEKTKIIFVCVSIPDYSDVMTNVSVLFRNHFHGYDNASRLR